MSACRNCGSTEVRDLGFIGQIAPFFLKRVFNLEVGSIASARPVKRLIQALMVGPQKALARIRRVAAMVEIQACTSCSFIQTKHGFAYESLSRLYRDYRSDTYNRERIAYEPSYRRIAEEAGAGGKETQTRINALTRWLEGRLEQQADFCMLDYGGADGRFLPDISGTKYVYEISDIPAASGVLQIRDEADMQSYHYIQLAHILEHVSDPLELVRKVCVWLQPGGYLYIEVPQDFTPDKIRSLVAGTYRGPVPIHEHINLYTVASASKLLQAAGLDTVSVETDLVDLGWMQSTNVRALARKA